MAVLAPDHRESRQRADRLQRAIDPRRDALGIRRDGGEHHVDVRRASGVSQPSSASGIHPRVGSSIAYRNDGGDGVLGAGFSLAGPPAIKRCPSGIAQDGEIRRVRYDGHDKLGLDGQRLVPVGQRPGIIEYRRFPETFVKVVGHYPPRGAPQVETRGPRALAPLVRELQILQRTPHLWGSMP
ncbi:hypothetical protein WME92_10555 [Sorangium sp. So ce307]